MIPPKKPLNERLRGLFTAQRPLAPQDVTAGPSGPGAAAGVFPGLLQAAGEVALGAVPGVGQAMDVRDFEQARREGSPLGMALAAAGGVPVAGDVVKQIGKAGRKAVQAARELPMDQASRMARAQEMGFTRDVYHGTRAQDIEAMRPSASGLFGPGVYTTTSPTEAGGYAINYGANSRGGAPNVLPLKARLKNPVVVSSSAEFWDKYGVVGKSDDEVIAALQAKGHDGVVFPVPVQTWDSQSKRLSPTGEMQEYVVVFDPKNLRSQFARFDPAQAGSSNLMAGLGALFAGGAAMNRRDEDQR
jgi:hypothetical protein